MASEIDICNSALVRLGANTISSFSDNSREADICDQIYERVRNSVLTNHPWNFAIKRASLPKLSSTPEWGFDNEHQLPADCLRVLNTNDPRRDFRIEGKKILSNVDPFDIRYIFTETLTGNYSAQFREVLEKKLALELSFSIVQSTTMQQTLQQEYQVALADARSFDAQEGAPEEAIVDDFLDSRISGGRRGEGYLSGGI